MAHVGFLGHFVFVFVFVFVTFKCNAISILVLIYKAQHKGSMPIYIITFLSKVFVFVCVIVIVVADVTLFPMMYVLDLTC